MDPLVQSTLIILLFGAASLATAWAVSKLDPR
jgi:hypothetical protein